MASNSYTRSPSWFFGLLAAAALLVGCPKEKQTKDTSGGGSDTSDTVSIDIQPVDNCGADLGGMDGSESAEVADVADIADLGGGDDSGLDTGAMSRDTAPADTRADVAADTTTDSGALDTGAIDTGAIDTGSVDTGAVDTGAIDTGSDDTGATDAGSSGDGGSLPPLPDDFTFESEYQMRFTEFAFTESSPGRLANNVIEEYLDQERQYPIVVLLHLRNIEPDEGTVRLRGGAGLKVDKKCIPEESGGCKYKWDPSTADNYREIQLDGETGELTGGLTRLDFIGRTLFEDGSTEKFTLPLHDLYFSDAVLRPTDDGEVEIASGTIRGYVTEEDAEDAKVQITQTGDPIPIASVLNSDLNYDSNDDGTLDAWCMEANFSASETEIVED